MLTSTCPRCGGRFQEGFTLDKGDHGSLSVPTWVEGQPEKSFWSGLKTKGRAQYPIHTLRCGTCGFLESYARK